MKLIRSNQKMKIIKLNQGMGLIKSIQDIQSLHRHLFNHNISYDTQ